MIYGFYFRFYQITHSKIVSIFLSKLAYSLYLLQFQFKRFNLKKNELSITSEKAAEHIKSIYPDPGESVEYTNPPENTNIDLSIVIPVYNCEDLIASCIESILNQDTRYRYELILINDGSTDGTEIVLDRYKNNSTISIITQNNQGIAGARNTGINHASGTYLMFVDNDDFLHKDAVEKLLSRAFEEDCDIVMGAHQLNKEKDGKVYKRLPNIYPQRNLFNYRNNDEIMNYAGLPWAKIYKRALWNDVRFFKGYWYEDTIIQFLLFTQCQKFAYIPEVIYEYRWYEKNFSHTQGHTKSVKAIDRYWLLKAILKQYEEIGLPCDGQYYTLLLKHLSAFYYPSISKLDKKSIESLFLLGCELIVQNKGNTKYELPYMLRVTEKAMLNRDIELWKLASKYQ